MSNYDGRVGRRAVLAKGGLALGGQLLLSSRSEAFAPPRVKPMTSRRPPRHKRTFASEAVEATIKTVKAAIADEELAWLFENCYPNTLDTTVDYEVIDGKPDTFVVTGDIDAMWLRDSTAQVWAYLPLLSQDQTLRDLVRGLIRRQVGCVLRDPYANAFYKDPAKASEWRSDLPAPAPGVHERKWELDSLCYVVRLAHGYYTACGDARPFDTLWDRAMRLIVKTLRIEQRLDGPSPYSFRRKTTRMTDAPVLGGTGRPARPNGMICSMFRPSDDATLYPFLVPSNIFAVLCLRQLSWLYGKVLGEPRFARECATLASQVKRAIKRHGVAQHLRFGRIYAYEVDGFGNRLFMDDANVPSLTSLAYLGAHKPTDALYKNTRRFLLSRSNPYFLRGRAAEGQASPHTGKERIWPMGIIVRALTSQHEREILQCLRMLKATHAGTGFMHEAFHKDDPTRFSRAWFAWANTLFGELILRLYHTRPRLLSRPLG